MELTKIALAGAATLGLALAGPAQAASTRAGESLPAVTAKAPKARVLRTSVPNVGESNIGPLGTIILVAAVVAAGFGVYELATQNDTPGG